jgi:hypothetical protein
VPWYIDEPDISDATETGELHHAPDSSGRSDDERDQNGPPPLHF